MTNREIYRENLRSHIDIALKMEELESVVSLAADTINASLSSGGRVFFCGNGGSAAYAQHLAAEFSGRYLKERRPLDGVALNCNMSALTAIGNDYSFKEIYSRQLESHGRSGDVLVAVTTSGDSGNILLVAQTARKIGMKVIAMTGCGGGLLREYADVMIAVPSSHTPRIQEIHLIIGHVLVEMIEKDY